MLRRAFRMLDPERALARMPELEPVPGCAGWREYIVLGDRRALIQRGDVMLLTGQRVDEISELFAAAVTYFTRSVYYHAMVYDHDWRFWHAFETRVFRAAVPGFFFNETEVALSWLRPRRRDGRPLTRADTARVVNFCRRQNGKKYDLWANAAFLFRADGMMWIPARIRPILWRLFQDRNWLRNPNRWHCSELAAAAWLVGAGVNFVDGMKQKIFVSPADIYDSIYTELVCTIKLSGGAFELLTAAGATEGDSSSNG
jgi:hypothetical protein